MTVLDSPTSVSFPGFWMALASGWPSSQGLSHAATIDGKTVADFGELRYRTRAVDQATVADLIELEQLLARYAVGMTKDHVEAVMDVFTPDGTYSAFGDTYSLEDFPRLVAAA